MSVGPAEVFDLGYRGYEGARTSRWRRRQAIWRDGIRISLGLGRGAGAKIAPWLLIAVVLTPVLVLIVIASFAGSLGGDAAKVDLPSFSDYYGFAIVPIGLFAAIVAPLLVCPDRQDGVLALYAARPLTIADYLAARWTAFLTVAAVATWLPEALLFVWSALDAKHTGSWLSHNWDVVPRFLAAGVVIAVAFTTLTLFMASFTARRAHAAVATLAVLFVGSAVGGIGDDNFTGRVAEVMSLFALPRIVVDVVHWIFGDDLSQRPLSGPVDAGWLLLVTAAFAIGLLRRTERRAQA